MCARKVRDHDAPCSDDDAILEIFSPKASPKRSPKVSDKRVKHDVSHDKVEAYWNLIISQFLSVLVASGLTTNVYYVQLLRTIE